MDQVQRVDWVDCARGIGIVLVVLGHYWVTPESWLLNYAIFSFHMPLFIFLTAMFLDKRDWLEVARSKASTYLLPYLSFLILMGVPALIGRSMISVEDALNFARRLSLGGSYLFSTFTAFWYMPAVYLGLVSYAALRNCGRAFAAALLAILLTAYAISIAHVENPVPYSLHAVPAIIVLIWIGRILPWSSRPIMMTVASCLTLLAAAWIDHVTRQANFTMGLKRGLLGLPIAGLFVAIAGSQMTFMAARVLSFLPIANAGLRYLGRTTVPILFLHEGVRALLGRLGLTTGAIVPLLSLLLPIAFSIAVARCAPFMSPLFGISVKRNMRDHRRLSPTVRVEAERIGSA